MQFCARFFEPFTDQDLFQHRPPRTCYLSDMLENLSNLCQLEEFFITIPIYISPNFIANRATTLNPVQLASVKRLELMDTKSDSPNVPPPIDGLVWFRAINAVFPNLEELSLRALNEDSLNAIQAYVHLLRLKKCSLVYRQS